MRLRLRAIFRLVRGLLPSEFLQNHRSGPELLVSDFPRSSPTCEISLKERLVQACSSQNLVNIQFRIKTSDTLKAFGLNFTADAIFSPN